MKRILSSLILFFCILISATTFAQSWKSQFISALKNGGALAIDENGHRLVEHRSDDHFIPASTLKVATAASAIKNLGLDYRFQTDFFYTPQGELVIKGYGDPALVSEEWDIIAKALRDKGLKEVKGILLDHSYFDSDINIDGAALSTDPYSAINGALIANYNTIFVQKSGARVASAEPQTPLTPLAVEKARNLPNGKQRVNLGKNLNDSSRYAGEILAEFLKSQGVVVTGDVRVGTVPADAQLLYKHYSTKTLKDNLKGLLEFSTNFITNQIFLVIGAEKYGAPANVEKGTRAMKEFLSQEVGWKDFEITEGSGLSRQNQVTPEQMMMLLNYFAPYRNLLPDHNGLLSKTGTLTGVNTLIGYFNSQNAGLVKFVILVNSPVPYDYKFKLGQMLKANLSRGL